VHLKEGYEGAQHLNPELLQDGQHYYVVVTEGAKMVERWLSNTMEDHKFYWQCRCHRAHYRWCTPNNLRRAADLLCMYCHANSAAWRKARRFRVVECEQDVARCVKALGIESEVTWQVQLPGWDGCLDFVHLPSMTIFQVDGCGHFKAKRASTVHIRLTTDIDCCKWAVRNERRLVRIHHKCQNMMQIMKTAIELSHTAFVLLTNEYNTVEVCTYRRCRPYVEIVAGKVAPAEPREVQDLSYILFV
jgi:hypothetical protein